jgi:hypothetical protein
VPEEVIEMHELEALVIDRVIGLHTEFPPE